MPADLPPLDDVLERIERYNDGRTHWTGCEREHLLCAVYAEIVRLRKELADARA